MDKIIESNPHLARLNSRQRTFVREYILNCGVALEAYLAAGYGQRSTRETMKKAAHRLLKTHEIQAAIVWEQAHLQDQYEVDKGLIVSNLLEVLDDCKQRVTNEIGGKKLTEMTDRAGALRALKLLGDTCGAFTENVQHGLSPELVEIFKSAQGTGTPPVHENALPED